MFDFGYPFIWTALNLLVLYFILKKILFKPVTSFMEKRSESIRESLENADKMKFAAEELYRAYEDLLMNAREEADEIISGARERGGREYERAITEAKDEVAKMMEKARRDIENERNAMLKESRNEIVSLALAAASKVLEKNMDSESNRQIIANFAGGKEGVA